MSVSTILATLLCRIWYDRIVIPVPTLKESDAVLIFKRSTRNWLPAFLITLVVAVRAGSSGAVEFPGSLPVPWNDEVTAGLAVPSSIPGREQLVVGTDSGYLRVLSAATDVSRFITQGFFSVGGRIVDIVPWEGLPSGQEGLVVLTANPDRLVFVDFTPGFPFFANSGAVDLDEDPGSIAFLGAPGIEDDEIAVSLPGVDRIVLIRKVEGQWAAVEELPAGDRPATVLGVNLDEDPERELLVVNEGSLSHSVARYDRQPGQGYARTRTMPFNGTPHRACLHDWNGDGLEDLVVADSDSNRIVALDAAGTELIEVGRVDLPFAPNRLLTVEQPGNAFGLFSCARDRDLVDYRRIESGVVITGESYYPGGPAAGLAPCDFNGDGVIDLAVLGGTAQVVSVMYGKSDFGFWAYPALALSGSPVGASFADLDGDGFRDLAAVAISSESLDFFSGRSESGFDLVPNSTPLPYYPGTVAPVQLDADTAYELLIYDAFSGTVNLLDYVDEEFVALGQLAVGFSITGVLAGDIDHDGWDDLLVYSRSSGRIEVYFGQGGAEFEAPVDWSLGHDVFEAILVDLNGDQKLELAHSDGLSRIWYALNSSGRSLDGPAFVFAGAVASYLVTGDLDNDGDEDLVVGNTGDATLSILENSGDGGLVRRVGNLAVGTAFSNIVCSDLDGNGVDDIVLNLHENQSVGAVFSIGDWLFSPVTLYPAHGQVSRLLVEDVDQDELPDLIALSATQRIGYVMLNSEMTFVALDPVALSARCSDGALEIRIRADRSGPWTLQWVGGASEELIATSAGAEIGVQRFEDGEWLLEMEAAQLDPLPVGANPRLRLAMGSGTQRDSRELALPPDCRSYQDLAPLLSWNRAPWPNPFNPIIRFSVQLQKAGFLAAEVYDVAGRLVRRLADGQHEAGEHTFEWRGDVQHGRAPAGAYFVLVRTEQGQLARKVLLLK